jgi:membrane protein required for colicin V production
MNWLDIAIVVALGVNTFFGLKNGLIKGVLSLAGLIVGVVLAGRFYVPLSEQLTFAPGEGVAKILAFAIILVGVMIIAAVLASLLKFLTSMMMLGWVNRLGGALFGLALGAITCGALLTVWIQFFGAGQTIEESKITRLLVDFFPLVLALLPGEFEAVRSFFQ